MSRHSAPVLPAKMSESGIYVTMRGFHTAGSGLPMYVRYARGDPVPIRVECREDETIHDLVKKLIIGSKDFGLDLAGIRLREGNVTVYILGKDGVLLPGRDKLSPRQLLKDIQEYDLEFETDLCDVVVTHAETSAVFPCIKTETFGDLARRIEIRIAAFNFQETYLIELRGQLKTGKLRVSEYSAVGRKSKVISPTRRIGDVGDRKFSFFVEQPKQAITCADIKETLCGQNVVFFGPPGNGKSSTINTFAKALGGVYRPLANTYQLRGPGTKVFKPYTFTVEEKSFSLCDVPGAAFQTSDDYDPTKFIQRILDGRLPAEKPLDYKHRFYMRGFGKAHCIVYIHKWDAELDELHRFLVDEAAVRGSGIPMVVIVTHIDLAPDDPDLIAEKCDQLAEIMGIDVANVFTVSNFDHEASHEDQLRDAHALQLLHKILASAKSFCDRGKVKVTAKVRAADK